MPPLPHYSDRERKFNIQDSQAAAWLAAQPDLLQWLFNACAWRHLIVFDPATRTWRGSGTLNTPPGGKESIPTPPRK